MRPSSFSVPIQVEGLRKNYGEVAAVRGIDFEVHAGEVFGLLGPNGDPEVQTRALKDRIGVCLQATRLQDKIKVREAMELFAALYTRTVDSAQLLKRLQLWEKREAQYATLSGGQPAL